MKSIFSLSLLFIFLVFSSCASKRIQLEGLSFKQQLSTLFPNAKISEITTKDHFTDSYQVVLSQPLDHHNPKAGHFDHYIYISHSGYQKPTVFITEGYSARPQTYELSSRLSANQVQVEYRFYGKSRPIPIPWNYLTNDQAIEDYHQIIKKLKLLYSGKFISTGISKGGETVLIYKSKYPKDIDIAVPYVAPLINTQEDPRTTNHINTVGTQECRDKIKAFQRALLENRTTLLSEIKKHATEKQLSFTEISMEEALEYAALEFSFSFWQWGGKCEEIPEASASPKVLFDYINKVVGISFYSDASYHRYLPSFYQHARELGYYGFDFTPVKDLLKAVKSSSNLRFAPKGVDLTYNPNYIKKVRNYAEQKGNQILYIYGEYDTWASCRPSPQPHLDALMMVLPKGSHSTRIKDFSEADQQKIMRTLDSWLDN